jgi:hypothetical protein
VREPFAGDLQVALEETADLWFEVKQQPVMLVGGGHGGSDSAPEETTTPR